MSVGADRTAQFANGGNFTNPLKTFDRPSEFVVHQRQFKPKGGRLRVNAVAAADARREFVFARLFGDGSPQGLHVGNENVRALNHLHGERRVHDIAACQTEVQPPAGAVIDFFGDGGGESDDIVVECFFQLLRSLGQRLCVGKTFVRTALHPGEIGFRHDAFLDQRLAGKEFNFQPDAELVFVGPDGPHFRA